MSQTYTPMMMQYLDIKKQHQDEIVFYRLGDFYEMFFDDALTASKELEITLTGRDAGSTERVPMCGVPFHAAEGYIARLVSKGYKVAICEQVEDAKAAKGIVRRDVIKIITPGTVFSDSMLNKNTNNYIALLFQQEGNIFVSACDVSTGEFLWYKSSSYHAVEDYLCRMLPAEIVVGSRLEEYSRFKEFLQTVLSQTVLTERQAVATVDVTALFARHFGEQDINADAKTACGLLLEYLEFTQKSDLNHISKLDEFTFGDTVSIDAGSLRNLEIIRNMRDGSAKDTLISVLDYTATAMGSRLLKKWLEYPLVDMARINNRQDAVEALAGNPFLLQSCAELLKSVQDIERILARLDIGSANARDMQSLKQSLRSVPLLKQLFAGCDAKILKNYSENAKTFSSLCDLLENAIVEQPPLSVREGGFIRDGYDIELDDLRSVSRDAKKYLLDMEARERDSSGIRSLKIGFNKVFGYYIEITHANSAAVPVHYTRKQTLANAERYITQELKDFENKILGAQERIVNIEYHLFCSIRESICGELPDLQECARKIAEIDVLYSLAQAAARNNYIRPDITNRGVINIKDGRHPVIEKLCQNNRFVPNDTLLDNNKNEIIIITGPNMAGKSTYMRQTALLVLLAHTGSFVPASSASICITDKIFTRIGASDDISTGQSTFMMEMNEVAHIVKNATRSSLIIFDEVGRGTSTYDGMCIARAILEYVKENIRAKTLFATHYHELTDLEEKYDGVRNYSVAVKERGNDVTFLHRIIPGRADKSYGIHVASLAGLPKKILQGAKTHLDNLEKNKNEGYQPECSGQSLFNTSSLFEQRHSDLLLELARLDTLSMTPIEAINSLYKLSEAARKETGNS